MEDFKRDVEEVKRDARAYAEAEVALLKVRALAKVTELLSAIVARYLLIFAALVPIFFALLALGFYLGQLLNSTALGFLSVAGISAFFILILFFFRRSLLTHPIQDAMISEVSGQLFQEDED